MTTSIDTPQFPSTGNPFLDEILAIVYAERYEPRDRLQQVASKINMKPKQQPAAWLYVGIMNGEKCYEKAGPTRMPYEEKANLAMHYEMTETPLFKECANTVTMTELKAQSLIIAGADKVGVVPRKGDVSDPESLRQRMIGRAEAVSIIINEDCEEPFVNMVTSNAIADTGDYSYYWSEKKLAEHFKVNAETWSLFENLNSRVMELHFENSELRDQNGRLQKALVDDQIAQTMITDISIKNGLNMKLQGGAVGVVASLFADQFRQTNPVNYIEMTMCDREGLELIVTLQKRTGQTPHQLRQLAENRYGWILSSTDHAEFVYNRLLSGDTKDQLNTSIDAEIAKES